MSGLRFIELEGVRVHNLRNISLNIRHNSLTVICGVSGSGKSSLAFDTLYAEGQRRYVETFSPSARQFLDRVERPAADRISGLPPAIAIRQQLRADGSRNTLGTRSEILDSLRILFAKAGRLYCPDCHIPVDSTSPESAAGIVLDRFPGSRLMIVAEFPMDSDAPHDAIARLVQLGYTRCLVDAKAARLEDLDVAKIGAVLLVVVDRLKCEISAEPRVAEAIFNAIQLTDGSCLIMAEVLKDSGGEPVTENAAMVVDGVTWQTMHISRSRVCSGCRRIMPELTSELLNFVSPLGACPDCEGTGRLSPSTDARRGKPSPETVCSACQGKRLNREAAAVQWNGITLPQVCSLELSDLCVWLEEQLHLLPPALRIGLRAPFEHAQKRLRFLDNSGLAYLSLDRTMKSLSGGEAQRVMLTTALGSGLINTLYVLDEPTAGLHATETQKIIGIVRELQKTGNTVVVVEHDPAFILAADHVIEIGPGAGEHGGSIVFEGTPDELLRGPSLTGEKLRERDAACDPGGSDGARKRGKGRQGSSKAAEAASDTGSDTASEKVSHRQTAESRRHRIPEQWLELTDVRCHNIHGLDVHLPLGVFCAITGVSGSGKSSLIADSLYPALCSALKIPFSGTAEGTAKIQGVDQIENVLLLDQSPVQRSRRSIPATWIGVFDDIRILLAETHEAKKRNYSRAMFSFNASSGGRCPVCEGRGVVTVEMQFLADIETVCEECQGRRFRPDVIEIRYRDRSVFDILNMTADEAFTFFNGHHRIQQRLRAVRQTGLGYLRLGQPLSTVSGGEAQRLRIAAMLAGIPLQDGETAAENRKSSQLTRSGRTLFLLDEPSSGLHLQDVERLVNCIDFLLQTGHSVIVIDHDEALTAQADWEIKLGPGPGKLGGQLIGSGPK